MNRKINRYERRALVATKNALSFKSASTQYVRINHDARYNFGTSDFFISMIVQATAGSLFFQLYGAANIGFQSDASGKVTVGVTTDQLSAFTPAFMGISDARNSNVRVSLCRRGASLELWINSKMVASGAIPGTDTINFNGFGYDYIAVGSSILFANPLNGSLSNIMVIKRAPSQKEATFLYNTNSIPSSLHQYVLAHYPMNEDHGQTAYDISQQYNYSKVTPTVNLPGALNNYTNNEVGIGVNPLDQTAWVNLYTGVAAVPIFKKALRLVRGNAHYLKTVNFNPTKEKGYTYIVGFALNVDRAFASSTGTGGGEYFLSKRSNSYAVLKYIYGGEGLDTMDCADPNAVSTSFKKKNNPQFAAFTEGGGTNKTSYNNGFIDSMAGAALIGWDEVPDNNELRIGSHDGPGVNSVDGYLFFIGIWKGILSQDQIIDITNNTFRADAPPDKVMADCHLYLDFNQIINTAGVYTVPDLSPQARSVQLMNYTINEITPGDPLYRLVNVDSLR